MNQAGGLDLLKIVSPGGREGVRCPQRLLPRLPLCSPWNPGGSAGCARWGRGGLGRGWWWTLLHTHTHTHTLSWHLPRFAWTPSFLPLNERVNWGQESFLFSSSPETLVIFGSSSSLLNIAGFWKNSASRLLVKIDVSCRRWAMIRWVLFKALAGTILLTLPGLRGKGSLQLLSYQGTDFRFPALGCLVRVTVQASFFATVALAG
jgi:hypothetical protein